MKKYLLLIAFFIVVSQSFSCALAASYTTSGPVKVAIKKYKAGNYTGCLQDMQSIVKYDPSNSVAYYYMAMSYAQAGKKTEAITAYQKVLGLKPNTTLYNYASKGKLCLETPDKCVQTEQSTEVDKMIASPYGDGLSSKVKNEIEKQHLDTIKNQINTDKDLDNYQFRQFKDYTKQHSEAKTDTKTAQSTSPSNDEIVAALRVLEKAGLNPYPQTANVNPYAQQGNAQSAEMAQISMMLNGNNGNNQGGNNNNAMMNMIPLMMAQSKNGQAGGSSYNPQMMQAMMMNSMLPDINFNTNDNK